MKPLLKKRRDGLQGNLLSFLDVISSGFGAIVMLLVISKTGEPLRVTEARERLLDTERQLAALIPAVELDNAAKQAHLNEMASELQALKARRAALARQAQVEGERTLDQRALATIQNRLERARQSLTEEMQRLLKSSRRRPDNTVGGVPIDSEHIVFIIDTSGSMQRIWPSVVRKLEQTLNVYPQVKGIQVMNDMGDLMFDQYAGRWITDTPALRREVIERLRLWQPFSNSSPVEGIEAAIRMYGGRRESFSIFIFGDEYSGRAVQPVINAVARLNPKGPDGKPRVRIHAIGFPTQYINQGIGVTGLNFALLMRELTAANGGTFVGLGNE